MRPRLATGLPLSVDSLRYAVVSDQYGRRRPTPQSPVGPATLGTDDHRPSVRTGQQRPGGRGRPEARDTEQGRQRPSAYRRERTEHNEASHTADGFGTHAQSYLEVQPMLTRTTRQVLAHELIGGVRR